jgi:Domain of unknown function (DUF4832)/Domain of unknown function (DUF4874)
MSKMFLPFQRIGAPALFVASAILAGGAFGHGLQAPADKGASAQQEIRYEKDESTFPNPERGFFFAIDPPGTDDYSKGRLLPPHGPMKAVDLRELRKLPEGITLVRDVIRLDAFWKSDISATRLAEIQADWDAVREAGLKVIPRFVYQWGMDNDDPEESVVLRHIDQLRPLLERNADVIASLQGGFLGGCGEGNASEHYVRDEWDNGSRKWQKLDPAGVRVYKALMAALPPDRFMTVRYPRYKWDLMGWSPSDARPMTAAEAFDGSLRARIGYYDDGFMGDSLHYAMFQMLGEGDFAAADSALSVFEGEISDATSYKLQPGQVVKDMERYHQNSLNWGGDEWRRVSAVWKQNGDYDVINRRMGYRLRLVKTEIATEAAQGGMLALQVEMTNDGFGRVYNPRVVEALLRNRETGILYAFEANHEKGNRLWLPGPGESKTLDFSAALPESILAGNYEVLLNLPDPAPRLRNRPEYSIRLASQRVWEDSTGFNRLLTDVRVVVGKRTGVAAGVERYVPYVR